MNTDNSGEGSSNIVRNQNGKEKSESKIYREQKFKGEGQSRGRKKNNRQIP